MAAHSQDRADCRPSEVRQAAPASPPRSPLQLPPNCVDRTAERVGTMVVIIGATAAGKGDEARMTEAGRPRIAPGRDRACRSGQRGLFSTGDSRAAVAEEVGAEQGRAHFLHGHATRIADIASTVNGRSVSSGKVSPYATTTSTSCWVVMPAGIDVERV